MLVSLMPRPKYSAALVVEGQDCCIRFNELTLDTDTIHGTGPQTQKAFEWRAQLSANSGTGSQPYASEPIAIIGIGCRFPKAAGPDAFWRCLIEGVDAIGEIPSSRFPVELLYDPRPSIPGRIATRYGGFLQDVELFDAEFFGISPREAAWLDPQQRLLLETAWEAIEVRRPGAGASSGQQYSRVCWDVAERIRGSHVPRSLADRLLHDNRNRAICRLRTYLEYVWLVRSQRNCRLRLLVFARCRPPCMPQSSFR